MNKRVTVEQAKKAIKMTRNASLVCGSTFMFGYPGETLDTIKETINFCRELLISPSLFFTTPYSGTKLYKDVKNRIIEKYGDEDKFTEALGDVSEFTINLTNFSDEELIKLRDKSVKLLRKIPFYRYPEYIYILHKQYGLFVLMKYFIKKIFNSRR